MHFRTLSDAATSSARERNKKQFRDTAGVTSPPVRMENMTLPWWEWRTWPSPGENGEHDPLVRMEILNPPPGNCPAYAGQRCQTTKVQLPYGTLHNKGTLCGCRWNWPGFRLWWQNDEQTSADDSMHWYKPTAYHITDEGCITVIADSFE